MTLSWPRALTEVHGPMRADKLDGAAQSMGSYGAHTRSLAAEGFITPDMMAGMTLFLLSNQPRGTTMNSETQEGSSGVAGGVWVRERFTIHRPLRRDERFSIRGDSMGRQVLKGRTYSTTRCHTLKAKRERAASNLTTGLLQYSAQKGLADSVEGLSPDDIPPPEPDWSVAMNNPCRDRLRTMKEGDEFKSKTVRIGLDLMQARDTDNPDNPIHSNPDLARKAGLTRPIAGGSHVLSFALELILAQAGGHALFHGACFDVHFKAPVYADEDIYPQVQVSLAGKNRVVYDFNAALSSGANAMTGRVTIPLA